MAHNIENIIKAIYAKKLEILSPNDSQEGAWTNDNIKPIIHIIIPTAAQDAGNLMDNKKYIVTITKLIRAGAYTLIEGKINFKIRAESVLNGKIVHIAPKGHNIKSPPNLEL